MRRCALLLIAALCAAPALAAPALAAPLQNQLANNPSPYLAQHAKDPVAWQEWNAQTVQRARQEGKLLFISIGYFACHWCHVMQRESYQNPEIAQLLNTHFIPVKVDREIHGTLDAELQAFAAAIRGQSGWPLNVFVTPEGYPLTAILYAPPANFQQSLMRLHERWQQDAPALAQAAKSAAKEMPQAKPQDAKFAPQIGALYLQRYAQEALAQADLLRGGFGEVNKFPHAPQLSLLLEIQQHTPQPKLGEFLRLTLERMASLGMHDAIAGGFFRYTVDPDWHTPHFEKMLYDNAQLAVVYLQAARTLKQAAYRDTALRTLDFMLAEMRDANSGAFITSLSAIDAHDHEGGAYLWDKAHLQKLLPAADYQLLVKIWRLDRPAELEDGYLPLPLRKPTAAEQRRLDVIYIKLKNERSKRAIPKDDKQLAGLNGLALLALTQGAREAPRYRVAAKQVRDFLVRHLITAQGVRKGMAKGQLIQEQTDKGSQALAGDLEDYAYVIAGLNAYAELSGDAADRELAQRLASQAWEYFYTPNGWQLEQHPLLARPYYQALVADSATFSPAALLIKQSWRLGGKALRTNALSALNTGYATLDQGAFWFASQISAMHSLQVAQ